MSILTRIPPVAAATRRMAPLGLMLLLATSGCATRAQFPSTWPVLHGDPGNTDSVPLAGPRDLVPRWQALQVKAAAANVAVGPNGRLYTTTMDSGPCHLHALYADGNTLWCSADVRWAFTFPVVAPDGTVFLTDGTEVFTSRRTARSCGAPRPPAAHSGRCSAAKATC